MATPKWTGRRVLFDEDGNTRLVQDKNLHLEYVTRVKALISEQTAAGTKLEKCIRVERVFQCLLDTLHIWRYKQDESGKRFTETVKRKLRELLDDMKNENVVEIKERMETVLFDYQRRLEFKCQATLLDGSPCSRDVSAHHSKFCTQHYNIKNKRLAAISAAKTIMLHETAVPAPVIDIIFKYCQ